MGLEYSRHPSPANALVHIVWFLAVYTLAQSKVKIGNIPIPNSSSSYTELERTGASRLGIRLFFCDRRTVVIVDQSLDRCPLIIL